MSKTNAKQLFQLQSVLFTNAEGIEDLDQDLVQSVIDRRVDAGRDFMTFLRNRGKVVIGELKNVQIDRSKPFNAKKFLDDGWKVDEEDSRSLALTEVDLTNVQFVDMLERGESVVNGEEKQKRLAKEGHIRLDAKIFQTLWENQALIPSSWKEPIGGNTRYIFFDGTILRGPGGYRYVLCLCWYGGRWLWSCSWLGSGWYACSPSAVLAS